MKPRPLLAAVLGLCVLGAVSGAEAQRPAKVPRLCFVTFDPGTAQAPSPRFDGFFQGLRELGYVNPTVGAAPRGSPDRVSLAAS